MKDEGDLPESIRRKFEVLNWRNALAILSSVHEENFQEVMGVLSAFELLHSQISVGGGNKSLMSMFIDQRLTALGRVEKAFDTKIVVDDVVTPSPTHKVNCFKGKIASGRPQPNNLWHGNDTFRKAISEDTWWRCRWLPCTGFWNQAGGLCR